MSLSGMISAAQIPPGSAGSLFQIPNASAIGNAGAYGNGLSTMKELLPITFDDGGAFSQMTSLSSDMTSHMVSKISDLPLQAGISQALTRQRSLIAQVDGLPAPSCSVFESMFKTVQNAGSLISDTLSSIGSAIGSALSPLYSAVQGIVGGVINSADSLLKAVGSAVGGVLTSIKAAIGPIVATMESTFNSFLSGIQSAVSGAVSSFTNWVAEEAAALTNAIAELKNFNFLAYLGVSDPCIANSVHSMVNFANVDLGALTDLKNARKVLA